MGSTPRVRPPDANPESSAEKPHALRVVIADTQSIYRVGIRKIFALEDDIRMVAQAETLGQTLAAVSKHPVDVLLFEAAITPNPAEAISEILKKAPKAKIIVVLVEADEEDTVDLLRRGVQGIVSRSISPDLLVKCVRKVANGETWLDNQGINWILDAYRAQAAQLTSPRPRTRISDKELLIISCVTQGMRNKEIAVELGTTEQVVKNYLRKIYDKLGVSDRLELALYCIHHHLLQNKGHVPAENAAAAAPAPAAESASPAK
jgi:DNA-binding NarL/FixJ family response regulator